MTDQNESGLELYRKYRPTKFSDLVGQADAVRTLVEFGKLGNIPHCLLLTGPSGVGKTTVIRILREKMKCIGTDYKEINCAESRGIDTIREIHLQMPMSALGGGCRVWALDECARLTGDSQSALLKMIEDPYPHCYFMLATTDPQKLLKTIITRSTEIKFKVIGTTDLIAVVRRVITAEGKSISDEVIVRIAGAADGSARKALVILQAVLSHASEADQMAAIGAADFRAQGIDLARALLKPTCKWADIAPLLTAIEDDPESVRRGVLLPYARKVLLGGGNLQQRAALMIRAFQYDYFASGNAGLALSCFDMLNKSQ